MTQPLTRQLDSDAIRYNKSYANTNVDLSKYEMPFIPVEGLMELGKAIQANLQHNDPLDAKEWFTLVQNLIDYPMGRDFTTIYNLVELRLEAARQLLAAQVECQSQDREIYFLQSQLEMKDNYIKGLMEEREKLVQTVKAIVNEMEYIVKQKTVQDVKYLNITQDGTTVRHVGPVVNSLHGLCEAIKSRLKPFLNAW